METEKHLLYNSTGLNESTYSIFYNTFNLADDSTSDNSSQTEAEAQQRDKLLKFVIQGICIIIVASFGIIGNILSACVLSNHRMRTSTSCLLLGLAVSDTILIADGIIIFGIPSICAFFPSKCGNAAHSKFGYLIPLFFSVGVTAQTASVYFTLAVTLERYLAVGKPFYARTICTWRRACYTATAVFLFSILYNLPRWWEYSSVAVYDGTMDNVIVGYHPIPTSLRQNRNYDIYYVNTAYIVIMYFLPILILIVLNVLIYNKVKTSNQKRRSLSTSQLKENSLAFMLLIVVAVFLLCNILPLVHIVMKSVVGTSDSIPAVECFRNFFVILNSSVNFVIYCSYGEKFREVLYYMLPVYLRLRCCTRRKLTLSNGSSEGSSDKRRFKSSVISVTTISNVYFDGINSSNPVV